MLSWTMTACRMCNLFGLFTADVLSPVMLFVDHDRMWSNFTLGCDVLSVMLFMDDDYVWNNLTLSC